MTHLALVDFKHRVVTSTERVQFSQIDPYGHLNAARYTEYIVNHRVCAVEEQLKVATVDIAKELGVAFVIARLDTRYLASCYLHEELEIASWVDSLSRGGFILQSVISGIKNKKVRAQAAIEIRTVDFKTGQVLPCPEALPSRAETNLLLERPLKADYLAGLKNYMVFE